MHLSLRFIFFILLFSLSAQAIEVFYCSNIFQLSNNLPIQRSNDSFEVLKILRKAENSNKIYYDNQPINQTLIENEYAVEQLNTAISILAADYPIQRFNEMQPLFIQLKKKILQIKKQNYLENDLVEAFTIYTFLVDARVKMNTSLQLLTEKIQETIDYFLFQSKNDISTVYNYRGRYLYTFAKPAEIDLLDFIRARALGYHIIGVTNLDRIVFDGFSKQGSSFFSKHDAFHAKQALKNDQKFIQSVQQESLNHQLFENREFLLGLVNKIELTTNIRHKIIQKIIVFHFDHELGLSLKFEVDRLFKQENQRLLNRELANIKSDIEFENYGANEKTVIGETNIEELNTIMKQLFTK